MKVSVLSFHSYTKLINQLLQKNVGILARITYLAGRSFSSFGTIAGSMESGNSTLNWIMSFPFSKGLRYVGMPSPKTHFRSPVLMHSPKKQQLKIH